MTRLSLPPALVKLLVREYSLGRSALYLLESWPLLIFNRIATKRWRKDFFPPPDFQRAAVEAARSLLTKDAERAANGMFPLRLLKPRSPGHHLRSLIEVWRDGLKVARRMRNKSHHDFNQELHEQLADLPAYYRRNFHYQSDGYVSESSAQRYDHQVEILFKGAAAAMRRLALVPLTAHFKDTRAALLEIGSGPGSATQMVALTLPQARITAVDLSAPYLSHARKTEVTATNVDFVRADGANLPFQTSLFDGAFSVFLFHELPREVRSQVVREARRCLKPSGLLVIVDSLQWDDTPSLNWGLERFPQDFHEPFYRDFVRSPLEDLLKSEGFTIRHRECGLFAKCIAAQAPD